MGQVSMLVVCLFQVVCLCTWLVTTVLPGAGAHTEPSAQAVKR